MNVLVVDDNASGRQLLVDIMKSLDLGVIEAGNGYEAVEKAREHIPDLMILDVNMPGLSGFEVVQQLKNDPATAQIPILLLTALTSVDSRVLGLSLGADDYLVKPYNPRELMERVKTRLRSKTATDELRQTQEITRSTFERYVSPQVVEHLMHNPGQLKLGGTLQEVTVLFADLEGFTSVSERTDPELLLTILNEYHTIMVSIIREHGGMIDKFIGDAVMALFNTPEPQPDHALQAVQSALMIRRMLPAFHKQFDPAYQMRVNFGISTGTAIIGNVGAPDMMNFTAVGDTVNLAARLQSLSGNGRILISEATRDGLHQGIRTEFIGRRGVKGRLEAVMMYEVMG